MKILIPVLGFGRSGGYRVLAKFANELIEIGHEVAFLSPDGSEDPYYPTIAKILWINSKTSISTTKQSKETNDGAISIQIKLLKGLKRISKHYDIFLGNHSLTMLPIKLSGNLKKAVYYVQAYEPDYYKEIGGFKNNILALLSSMTYSMNVFTIVNSELYKNYKKLKCRNVLYPGIDHTLFFPKQNKETATNNRIVIGTVGGGGVFKGTQYVINAFKEIKKIYSNVELRIAFGEKVLEKIDGIYVVYPDGDENLGKFYRSLNYYICGNYSQTGAFHYPVVEAMASGVTLITTEYYPANKYNSWQVSPKNQSDILSKFQEAHLNQQEQISKIKQGLNDIKQFEWKLAGKRLEGYLFEALNNINGTDLK